MYLSQNIFENDECREGERSMKGWMGCEGNNMKETRVNDK